MAMTIGALSGEVLRVRSFRSGLVCFLAVMACAMIAAPPVVASPAGGADGDGGVSAFYLPPARVPGGPGHMVRTEALTIGKLPPSVGRAERFLNTATSGVGRGATVVVSGLILLPKGVPPEGGWPVVGWAHGTTGIADVCAPSWRGYSSRDRAYLDQWLRAGFAIVASDYEGLGTPGPHPYLLYRPEGYSTLDALRAALAQYHDLIANRIILVGQSQGGGAALGAAWLAPRYAPALNILGTVATGVVIDIAAGAHPPHPPIAYQTTESPTMNAAFGILTVEGTEKSLHPGEDVEAGLTPRGRALGQEARQACLGDLFKYTRAQGLGDAETFRAGHPPIDLSRTAAFRLPDGHLSMPVFVGTGLADGEAGVTQQYNAVAAMCDAGTHVLWRQYPGLTHNGAVNVSTRDSVPFALGLLRGRSGESSCATIRPLRTVEAATPGIPWNH